MPQMLLCVRRRQKSVFSQYPEMELINKYIIYVRDIRRYSQRTVEISSGVLKSFISEIFKEEHPDDATLVESMNIQILRKYEVCLLDDRKLSPRTVWQHLSVLSGFCKFLMKEGLLESNPVRLVPKPKLSRSLPEFYRKDLLEEYFSHSYIHASAEFLDIFLESPLSTSGKDLYQKRLARLVISLLYGLGLRRAELISLNISDIDFIRKTVKVHGKGDKIREIPIVDALCEEILLYLKAVDALVECKRSLKEPLLITYTGRRLYPEYVSRVVKSGLSAEYGFTGRKSPHVLRHSIATELLNSGTDLNSIKELLGHSSLAATQVYTHNTIAQLKCIYESAHPRAKNGGKHGD